MPEDRQASQVESNLNEMLDEDDEMLNAGTGDDNQKQVEYDMAPSERAEALKILGKRQRRVGKIEECGIDIYRLFERQKWFSPSKLELALDGNETAESCEDHRLALNDNAAKELNKKLVNSIIEQV